MTTTNAAPRILVAVDGSPNGLRAVDHVATICRGCGNMRVTLLHVVTIPPELIEHQGAENPGQETLLEQHVEAQSAAWRESAHREAEAGVFKGARARLEKIAGVEVNTQVATTPHGRVALGILAEMVHGYDAVVVGRGAHSKIEEVLSGSVTRELLKEGEQFALWLVL